MRDKTWITNGIRFVCQNYKKRTAGSQAERECQLYFAEQLSSWADEVHKEPVTFHPNAFIGSILLQALLGICAAVCFWLAKYTAVRVFSVFSCIAAMLALLSWILEYVLYFRAFDWLYPKEESTNVIATRKASGKTKKRIIFVGHADAAYEMPLLLHAKAWMIILLIVVADIGLVLTAICGVIQMISDLQAPFWSVYSIYQIVFVLCCVSFLFFVRWNTVVDGANDNLSGCFIGMAILREMSEQNQRFENTDICCLITTGEESGLRGALAYAEKHLKELQEIDTVVIALDTIHEIEQLMVYTRGINGTQKNSRVVCDLLRSAAKACAVELPDAGFYPGANDSEAFSRYGIKAAAICGVRHTPAPYYHTRFDSWDNINPDCISLVIDVCKKVAELFAEQSATYKA